MQDLIILLDEVFQASGLLQTDPVIAEQVRKVINLYTGTNPFRLWDHIEQQIGKAGSNELRKALIELRDIYSKRLCFNSIKYLNTLFTNSPQEGWKQWVITIAEGISYLRGLFCLRVCEEEFPFAGENIKDVEQVRRGVKLLNHTRWAETTESVKLLIGKEFISTELRAMLMVIAGQIELYQFSKPNTAKTYFDEALSLSPADGYVICGQGDYWLDKNDFAQAKIYYDKGIELSPELSLNYIRLGEIFERKGDPKNAEKWYLDNSLYESLLKLYGLATYFEKKRTELPGLVERNIEINPENTYSLYISMGSVYETNNEINEAHKWYQKAIQLDTTRLEGYIKEGYCYGTEKKFENAETNFREVIKYAPEASDGQLGLAWLMEQMGKLEEALVLFRQCLVKWPESRTTIRINIASLLWKLNYYSEAIEELKTALPEDENNSTLYTLENYAIDYYKKLNEPDTSIRIYDFLLKVLGDSYEADYHNRVGNLRYYFGDFKQAADEYIKAIKAAPGNPVFHRNLSLAYKGQKMWKEALEKLEEARLLDNDQEAYGKEAALIFNLEGNDFYGAGKFREAAEKYSESIESWPYFEVVHKNLAGAWENLNEPGGKAEALGNAINALTRAMEINPKFTFSADLEILKRKKEFVENFGENSSGRLNVVTPLAIEVAADLVPYVENKTGGGLVDNLISLITKMRDEVLDRFGVKIPSTRLRGNSTDLPNGSYIIVLMEIPLVLGEIRLDEKFSPNTQAVLKAGIEGRTDINPLTGDEGFWIKKEDWAKAESEGLELWDIMEYPVKHLQAIVQSNLVEFLGNQELYERVSTLDIKDDALFEDAEKFTAFTNICRALVYEKTPVKDLKKIFETFLDLRASGFSLLQIVEAIRSLPEISPQLWGNEKGAWTIFNSGGNFENEIDNYICSENSHEVLVMEPGACQSVLTAVRNKIGNIKPPMYSIIVVERESLRPFVRSLIELEFPAVPVLSAKELQRGRDRVTFSEIELDGPVPLKKYNIERRIDGNITDHTWKDKDGGSAENEAGGKTQPVTIRMVVNDELISATSLADEQPFNDLLELMRDGLFYELGIILPLIKIESDPTLNAREVKVFIGDKEFIFKGIDQHEFLANDTVSRLSVLGVKARKTVNPANGNEFAIVEDVNDLALCKQKGLTTWGPAGYIVLHVSSAIRKNASMFQDLQITQFMLDLLKTVYPKLVELTLKRFSLEKITLILKDLLEEEITIRDLRSILDSLLSITATTNIDTGKYIAFIPKVEGLCFTNRIMDLKNLTINDYTSFVRMSLRRYISHKYTKGQNTLIVYLIDPGIENRIMNIEWRPLTEEERTDLLKAISIEVDSMNASDQKPVILTSYEVRKPLKKLISKEFPDLVVLSYQELSPEMNIQPIARISLK